MSKIVLPIALASAKKTYERHQNGEKIKGTGRRKTEYRRPPIVELIKLPKSIQGLGRLRGALAFGAMKGTIDPSAKTERAWEKAFWQRVLELMLTTRRPCFVYCEILRWAKPTWAAEAIEIAFMAQCKSLPSPAEELLARGIVIEGITS